MSTTQIDPTTLVVQALRDRIPGFPDDFSERLDERLSDVFTHSQKQALIYASRVLAPSIPREAFHPDATGNDLIHWLGNAEGPTPEPSGLPPRGSYRSANATMRPIEDADIMALYRASLQPQGAHRWRSRGRTPSPELFRQLLYSDGNIAQFMVIPVGEPQHPVGLVSAYGPDFVTGNCYVAVQRLDGGAAAEDPTRGLMVEGTLVFFQYLFDHFDLHKIYLELPEFNRSLLDGGAGSILVEEACLREHIWFGDRLWDQYTYALYRRTWEEVASLFRGTWPDGRGLGGRALLT